MALWGNLNQPVNANSTTNTETTNGAIIGVGSRVDWGEDNTFIVVSASNVNFGNVSSWFKSFS